LAPYSVQNGLFFVDRIKDHQTAAVTEVLSHEIKTGSRHANMGVFLPENQENRRPSQYFVLLTSEQTEQRVTSFSISAEGVDFVNRTKEQTGIGTQ